MYESGRCSLPRWIVMRTEIKNVGSSVTFASFEHLCSHVHLSRGKRAESETSVCTWKEQIKDEIFIPSFHPHLHLSSHLLSLAFSPSPFTPRFPGLRRPLLTFLGLFLRRVLDAWTPSRLTRQEGGGGSQLRNGREAKWKN